MTSQYNNEQKWTIDQLEMERNEIIQKAERAKYIAQQTVNMSQREKETWIEYFEEQEISYLEDDSNTEYGESLYDEYLAWQRKNEEQNALKIKKD
jgi:hypothetical protein